MGKSLKKIAKVVGIVIAVVAIVIAVVALCVVTNILGATTIGLTAEAATSFGSAFLAIAKAGTTLIIGAILSASVAAWQQGLAEEKQRESAQQQEKELTKRVSEAKRSVENHNREVFEKSLGDWDGGSLGFTEGYDPPSKDPESGVVIGRGTGQRKATRHAWIPIAAFGAALTMLLAFGGDDGSSVKSNP